MIKENKLRFFQLMLNDIIKKLWLEKEFNKILDEINDNFIQNRSLIKIDKETIQSSFNTSKNINQLIILTINEKTLNYKIINNDFIDKTLKDISRDKDKLKKLEERKIIIFATSKLLNEYN